MDIEIYPDVCRTKDGLILTPVGMNLLSIFANIEGVAIIVVEVFSDGNQKNIHDEYVTNDLDIEVLKKKIQSFANQYEISFFFTNRIGNTLSGDVEISHGIYSPTWEIVELEGEEMLFLVQTNIKNISFKKKLKRIWESDLRDFDLKKIRANEQSLHRIFAMAQIISGAKISYNGFYGT